jgi:hypothetical protein
VEDEPDTGLVDVEAQIIPDSEGNNANGESQEVDGMTITTEDEQ